MAASSPRRLTLLYQLYLASQASRNLMRLAMRGTGMTGEEYALASYLHVNGPRTLTQGARDLGMPLTTLATLLAGPLQRGEVERGPHPTDRRARLLRLTDAGERRMQAAIPAFVAAYRIVLAKLEDAGADVEGMYEALEGLRTAVTAAVADLGTEATATSAAGTGRGRRGTPPP